jgi:hypothetical protein
MCAIDIIRVRRPWWVHTCAVHGYNDYRVLRLCWPAVIIRWRGLIGSRIENCLVDPGSQIHSCAVRRCPVGHTWFFRHDIYQELTWTWHLKVNRPIGAASEFKVFEWRMVIKLIRWSKLHARNLRVHERKLDYHKGTIWPLKQTQPKYK